MLNNILNLDGVTVLDKKQQKEVNGGGGCRLTTFTNGVRDTYLIMGMAEDEGTQTAGAHNACGDLLNGGADRCFYDCTHDN
ncbi:hypothetical protein [Polaribacter sp. IC073]|uniref:hypothetical protein n=1 Tax=Polaribacter sp. IC073 TaxID=2508540 RepID=UPI0011BE8C61|nr:hypothetical protein [Polaribacter sp. IC073]TXD50053.1 hypothetical protein ES045_02415 [Polaribacter sp. IC073]